ncbi:MAG: sirohydrochlorin cobaltochelatase [Clostridia bacterium]
MGQTAILVVSFGTTVDETRERTIGALERQFAAAYPQIPVFRAFTSSMIIRSLARRGIFVDTVAQALARLSQDHFRQVLIQPTHLIPGTEYDKLCAETQPFRTSFDLLKIGHPLLSCADDFSAAADAMAHAYPTGSDEALVLMGHGTAHPANDVYPAFERVCQSNGYDHLFIGTVEGIPTLEMVIRSVTTAGFTHAALAPFMLVAGDHALNDMAGSEPGSWLQQFSNAGISTRCLLTGIGELPGIQQIYLQHLNDLLILK